MMIVTLEEAEQADVVVCIRKGAPTPFTDNVEGICSWCSHPVVLRAHAPAKPSRVCLQCISEWIEGRSQ